MPQFIMHTGRSVKGVIANENGKTSYNESRKLFSCIPEDERHDIWCYNLGGMGFYTLNGVSPSNRIFCSWHFDTDPELKKRETILNHRPLWLLVNPESIYRDNYEVIENEYELIGTIEDCFDEKIELYRLEK